MDVPLKWLIITVIGLVLAWVSNDVGLFTKVVVRQRSFPEFDVAYYEFTGSYQTAWTHYADFLQKLEKRGSHKLTGATCFGIYYDDPSKVADEDCRCVVGVALPRYFSMEDKGDGIKFGKIGAMENADYIEYPEGSNLLSLLVAMWRSYPKLGGYIKEHRKGVEMAPSIELYMYDWKKYLFVQPVWKEGLWLLSGPPDGLKQKKD